jgi:hypothetical protein
MHPFHPLGCPEGEEQKAFIEGRQYLGRFGTVRDGSGRHRTMEVRMEEQKVNVIDLEKVRKAHSEALRPEGPGQTGSCEMTDLDNKYSDKLETEHPRKRAIPAIDILNLCEEYLEEGRKRGPNKFCFRGEPGDEFRFSVEDALEILHTGLGMLEGQDTLQRLEGPVRDLLTHLVEVEIPRIRNVTVGEYAIFAGELSLIVGRMIEEALDMTRACVASSGSIDDLDHDIRLQLRIEGLMF